MTATTSLNPMTAAHPLPPRRLRAIARRWLRWAPWMKIRMGQIQDRLCIAGGVPTSYMAAAEHVHKDRLSWLLSRGLDLRDVDRLGLDDPRLVEEDMRERAEKFLLKRSVRKPYVRR